MTTYVQKKSRFFMERPEWLKPERRRSESRMKTYPSSTDLRNWCDTVEDRRQHILELVTKGFDKCAGKLIPLDVLLDMVLAMSSSEVADLRKKLKELSDFVDELHLSEENIKKLKGMATNMDNTATMRALVQPVDEELSEECDPTCVAAERHSNLTREVNELVADTINRPTIQSKVHGPGKMVTRIKGLHPGFQIVDDPARPERITIKPAKRYDSNKPAAYIEPQILDNVERFIEVNQQHGADKPLKALPVDDLTHAGDTSPDKIAAMEALCNEQKDKIKTLTKERDDLKTKLDACLKELDNFKKLQTVANPSLPNSCQQEIEALEAEIKIMRMGNPSPEEEAAIIQKEVEILKRYCSKLKDVENENERLKVELGSRVAIKESEPDMAQEKIETLKDKLKHLEELTNERDSLANKVHELETQLLQYQDLPADVELLKNRSDMLDSVMEERDNLNQKIKMMKGMEEELQKFKSKADRVDELERELKNMNKGDRNSGLELRKTRSIADNLEIELQNVKCERDAMRKRIENMKKELESQKAKVMEAEMLRLERDRLQIKLNELADIQAQYEETMNKMKIYDTLKAERDTYKQKYEEVLDMECKCEMLKAQFEEARTVGRERDQLQKQVQDLEACICEQETEIKSLVLQVDDLSRNSNNKNDRLNTYKEEMALKDRLLAASQDQLIQSQNLAVRIKELEKMLHNAEHTILQKDCHIKCLENELRCKAGSFNSNKNLESVEQMRRELQVAKAENKKLQEIANKMLAVSGDDHVKKMLKQSECAVKRVVQELGKQYKEWDHMKGHSAKGKFGTKQNCICHRAGDEASSGDDCEKLREELIELQKEKQKLELTVKQLQDEGVPGSGSTRCTGPCRKI